MPMFSALPPRPRKVVRKPMYVITIDPLNTPQQEPVRKAPIRDGDSRNAAYGASRKQMQQTKYWRP